MINQKGDYALLLRIEVVGLEKPEQIAINISPRATTLNGLCFAIAEKVGCRDGDVELHDLIGGLVPKDGYADMTLNRLGYCDNIAGTINVAVNVYPPEVTATRCSCC